MNMVRKNEAMSQSGQLTDDEILEAISYLDPDHHSQLADESAGIVICVTLLVLCLGVLGLFLLHHHSL
jgi:hypothetical protein